MNGTPKLWIIKQFLYAVIVLFVLAFSGCGQEEHEPYVSCLNFGRENVRRNIKLRARVSVGRPPLNNVSSETVRLFKLSPYEQVAGVVQYAGNQIIFVPSAPLTDSTRYHLEITEEITDKSGKQMRRFDGYFTTGNAFQVYYCDLLYDYDSSAEKVYSIAIYFTESANPDNLIWGVGYISLYDSAFSVSFSVSYYDQIACAVLHFSPYLEINRTYRLEIGPHIYSMDGVMLDGDRDGEWQDQDPFILVFKYGRDYFGEFGIAESTNFASPYLEPDFGCIFYQLD